MENIKIMKTDDIQAFPLEKQVPSQQGMTLRDYFAAKALTIVPFIAKEVFQNQTGWGTSDIAEEAYRIADAMLKERKK